MTAAEVQADPFLRSLLPAGQALTSTAVAAAGTAVKQALTTALKKLKPQADKLNMDLSIPSFDLAATTPVLLGGNPLTTEETAYLIHVLSTGQEPTALLQFGGRSLLPSEEFALLQEFRSGFSPALDAATEAATLLEAGGSPSLEQMAASAPGLVFDETAALLPAGMETGLGASEIASQALPTSTTALLAAAGSAAAILLGLYTHDPRGVVGGVGGLAVAGGIAAAEAGVAAGAGGLVVGGGAALGATLGAATVGLVGGVIAAVPAILMTIGGMRDAAIEAEYVKKAKQAAAAFQADPAVVGIVQTLSRYEAGDYSVLPALQHVLVETIRTGQTLVQPQDSSGAMMYPYVRAIWSAIASSPNYSATLIAVAREMWPWDGAPWMDQAGDWVNMAAYDAINGTGFGPAFWGPPPGSVPISPAAVPISPAAVPAPQAGSKGGTGGPIPGGKSAGGGDSYYSGPGGK